MSFILSLWSNWADKNIPLPLWYVCMGCVSASSMVVMTHITSTYMPQPQLRTQVSSSQSSAQTSQVKVKNGSKNNTKSSKRKS